MKKLLIVSLLCASGAFAQTKAPMPPKNPDSLIRNVKNDYIGTFTKTLKYQILIRENNKDIFKSSFEVKNGKEFTLLTKEISKQNQTANQKEGIYNKEQMLMSIEGEEKEEGNIEQLKLLGNIGKDKNIFSEISWKNVNMEKAKKLALLAKEDKAAVTEEIPSVNTFESSVLVTHQNNQETFFTLDKKEFSIKAHY